MAQLTRAASDGLLTNSEATRNWFRAASGATDIEMAYPIDQKFRGDPATTSPPSNGRLILAGRVSSRKGHLDLARACEHLCAEGRSLSLTLTGAPFASNAQRRALDELLAYSSDRPWIHYVGELSPEDLRCQMAEHDLCVMASNEVESFGLVILDAWASRLPSLAPAFGGAVEATALVNGASYWPDPTDPVRGLTSALRFTLDHPALMSRPSGDEPVRDACTSELRAMAWDRLLVGLS